MCDDCDDCDCGDCDCDDCDCCDCGDCDCCDCDCGCGTIVVAIYQQKIFVWCVCCCCIQSIDEAVSQNVVIDQQPKPAYYRNINDSDQRVIDRQPLPVEADLELLEVQKL